MAQIQVFVSHNHKDTAFCQALVKGLRDAGADVWYDEHNMGSGRLGPTIERELRHRPVFVVVLSPDALQSQWVEDETRWAYRLYRKDPSRIIQPVTARALNDDDVWLFLQDFKRIEASGYRPYPTDVAIRRLLHTLALTPANEAPASTAPQPSESFADLLERGKALKAQKRYAEALPLFERATQLRPSSFDAWANLGVLLNRLSRYSEALPVHERALALDGDSAVIWNNKGAALTNLKRYDEALDAYNRALALDPGFFAAWNGKGNALYDLTRYAEALDAYNQALTLDANYVFAWNGKGDALYSLARYDEALDAYNRTLALDPSRAAAWFNKGNTLYKLMRYTEALAAYDRAFDRDDPRDWRAHASVYRALGRTAEAEAAERRAKELGG